MRKLGWPHKRQRKLWREGLVKVARKGEEKKQAVSLGWSLLVEREESKVGHFQKRVEGERVAFLAGETKGCYFSFLSFSFLFFRGKRRGFSLFWGWEKRASRGKKKGKGSKKKIGCLGLW